METTRWFTIFFVSELCLSAAANPTVATAGPLRTSDGTDRVPDHLEPCRNATTNQEGYCMFAMDCRRVRGRHVAVCMKGFYYGTCCSIQPTEELLNPLEDLPRIPIDINAIDLSSLDLSLWSELPYQNGPYSVGSSDSFFQPSLGPYGTAITETHSNGISSSLGTAAETVQNNATNIPIIYATGMFAVEENESTAPNNVTVATGTSSVLVQTPSLEGSSLKLSPSSTVSMDVTTSPSTETTVQLLPGALKKNFTLPEALIAVLSESAAISRNGNSVCGKPVYRWPKIVSGENARPGQWPWMVSLQERTRRGYYHKCGASLLNNEWALTAAHCLNNIQQENLLVKYGGIDFASIDDKFYESKVLSFQHPKFSVQNQQYDIALLKLLSPVSYQFNVLPICLPDKEMAFEYDQSIVAGWGKLSEKGTVPTKLQYVGIPIINNTECQTIYQSINKFIGKDLLCSGYPMGQKDSCEGDSGGPVMVFKRGRWVAAGVISWGVGCARPNQPGVSTRVTEFLDWINSYVLTESR